MTKIIQSNWETVFKKDIKQKLLCAEKEYFQYKQTGYIIYLQQAGNKLFSVVENWLMLKYKKRVRGYQELVNIISQNNNDSFLLAQSVQLHYFFYNGELQMSKQEAEILFKNISRKMKQRIIR